MATPATTTPRATASSHRVYFVAYKGVKFGFRAPHAAYDGLAITLGLAVAASNQADEIVMIAMKKCPQVVRIRISYEIKSEVHRTALLWCNVSKLPLALTQLRNLKYKGKTITYAAAA